MTNLLDLHDDDRWAREQAFHSAGHALGLVLIGHELTQDDLESTLTLSHDSEHRPFVAALGVLALATAWAIDIADHNQHARLDAAMIDDSIAHVLSEPSTCCYHDDADDDLENSLDEVGLPLLDDPTWVDNTLRRLLRHHWPALTHLAELWLSGDHPDPQQATTILRTDRPSAWAEETRSR